jgi:hypothetical protein
MRVKVDSSSMMRIRFCSMFNSFQF